MPKNDKTSVMRILDREGIAYTARTYELTGERSGTAAAAAMGVDPAAVYKTLVTVGASGRNYVFVVPASAELDLKKAAKSVGEKSIEMIKQKELLPLTGYIHGGCSPIGMKKLFPTTVDSSAETRDTIIFSAGKLGHQVELCPEDLGKVIPINFSDICQR